VGGGLLALTEGVLSVKLPQPAVRSTADRRMPFPEPGHVVNAMTVDVEDYFQVSAFDGHVRREQWPHFESRVVRNTERLLQVFADHRVTGTFFVLGWVAKRFPRLIRRIAAEGHELASHGYSHRLVYEMSREEFAEDLRRARGAIGEACGALVTGYRAPSFSITETSLWAIDELIVQGYEYDASIFPIHHDRYGIPDAPRHPYALRRPAGSLWEIPGSTVRCGAYNLPIAGGGYFRLFPYAWTRWGIRHVNGAESQPVVFYLHPWEIDPDQPRLETSRLSRFRHYRNLAKTEARLHKLLSEFRFTSAASLLSTVASAAAIEPTRPLFDLSAAGVRN
jgi:polysaccharide deacetylase family protein (PEP-CTERM system associated)